MGRGRKPGDVANPGLKLNWDRSARGGAATVMPEGTPAMPDDLSEAEGAVWDAVVPNLTAAGLAETDGHVIARYCRLVCEERQLWAMLEGVKPLDKRRNIHAMLAKTIGHLEKCEKSLGLTPAARKSMRIGLQVEHAALDDDGYDFFGRGS